MKKTKYFFEKCASLGTVLSAAICPACFPALAGIGSALGLGFFAQYEREALIIMQIFIIVNLLLAYLSFRRTKYIYSFILALLSGGMMLFSWYIIYHAIIFYIGMIGIVCSAFWNFIIEQKLPSCNDGSCSIKHT